MRVVETFGPTVQGEGPYAGRVCHFLRLGGCDFRCSWCDTPHAVLPHLVRKAENLKPADVVERLGDLPPAPMLVISGGNPALQKLDPLLDLLGHYDVIALETQGSRWKPWLMRIDSLVCSPKAPSSGECTADNLADFAAFMLEAVDHKGLILKIVVFNSEDLEFAQGIHGDYPHLPFYLSAGTDQDGADHADTAASVGARYGWLCDEVIANEMLHDACVLPQLHVIAWGHKTGV